MTAKWSSVSKKFVSGLTGLLLVLFLVGHLIGNLLIYVDAGAFNYYAYFLETVGHGWALYAVEAGLLFIFGAHIISGVSVALKKRKVRSQSYYTRGDAGGASRKSLASRSMIITGLVVMVFVVIHVRMFKYSPAPFVEGAGGHEMRDLHLLVVQAFKSPLIALSYTAVMILVGLHLRHGIWSAFQSLGINHPRYTPIIYLGGATLAVLLAVGFLLFPLIILIFFGSPEIGGHV